MIKAMFAVAIIMFSQVSVSADLGDDIRVGFEGEKQVEFINKFAVASKNKDAESIYGMLAHETNTPEQRARADLWLNNEVYPFFARFVKIHNYNNIMAVSLPNGSDAIGHFTFIVLDNEKILPFSIAIISTTNGPKIYDFVPNQCIKGRHLFCP